MSRKIGELENKIKVIESKEIEVEEMKESNKIAQHAPMIGSNFKKNPALLSKNQKQKKGRFLYSSLDREQEKLSIMKLNLMKR